MLHFSNTIKFGVVLSSFILLSDSLIAQFTFNTKGQLTEAPPPRLKKGEVYSISLTTDLRKYLANISIVKRNVDESSNLILDGENRGRLQEVNYELAKLYYFFTVSGPKCADGFISTLARDYGIRKDFDQVKNFALTETEKADSELRKTDGRGKDIEKLEQEYDQTLKEKANLKKIIDTFKTAIPTQLIEQNNNFDTKITDLQNKIKKAKKPAGIIDNSCLTEECLCRLVPQKLKRIAELEELLIDLMFRKQFAQELFSDFDPNVRDVLFRTKESNYTLYFASYNQATSAFLPEEISFSPRYRINSRPLSLASETDSVFTLSGTYTADKKVSFSINSVDPLKSLLLQWHNKTSSYLRRSVLERIYRQISSDTSLVSGVKQFEQKAQEKPSKGNIGELQTFNNRLSAYDYLWNDDSPIMQYLREWYWYSGGDFRLNYTGLIHEDNTADRQGTLKLLQEKESRLKEQISKAESIINCIECREKGLDTLQRLQDSLQLRKSAIAATQSDIKKVKKAIEKDQAQLKTFTSVRQVLHQVTLLVEGSSGKQYIIYHDAANDLSIINDFKFRLNNKYILPEGYDIHYGLLNCSKPEGEFTISEVQEAFNDTAVFTRELSNALKPLAAAALTLAPYSPQMISILGSAFGSFQVAPRESIDDPDTKKFNEEVNDISYRLWKLALMQKMLRDYLLKPTPGELEETAPDDTSNYTYAVKAKKWAAPYTNKYSFSKDNKVITGEQYSIGRQKTLALGAGIFFNAKSARQQTVDTTGNIINVTNSDSKAKFVIGAKIYPFKCFDAENSLIPRFPEKRFHLFAGFEITKPLENLYAGIGYDIVPGLQVSYGAHIYRRDYYSLRNGQVTDKTTSYKISGAYYGVTIDPVVLVDVLKTFFK